VGGENERQTMVQEKGGKGGYALTGYERDGGNSKNAPSKGYLQERESFYEKFWSDLEKLMEAGNRRAKKNTQPPLERWANVNHQPKGKSRPAGSEENLKDEK